LGVVQLEPVLVLVLVLVLTLVLVLVQVAQHLHYEGSHFLALQVACHFAVHC
jgi:hypothetical protein